MPLTIVERLLEFRRCHVVERLEQTMSVVPLHPSERRGLEGAQPPQRPPPPDALRLVQPDHALGQRVVVGIATAPDRQLDARGGEPLRVADRQILEPEIAVVDTPRRLCESALLE